ncbi:MAG: [Fe-Fe] hydrogenase large subunit C-terminal domain-containing protein [Candidatus Anstonellales archaeon]
MLYGHALFSALEREKKEGKILVGQLAPAVRVSIGEEFGLPPGTELTAKTISLLKTLGFHEVIDTPIGADLITLEEAKFFVKTKLAFKPLLNSCCVGWREYCKSNHKALLCYIGSIVSPMMATGFVTKTYLADKMGVKPKDMISIGVMPCTIKKLETKYRMRSGLKYVDYVITAQELGQWAKSKGLDIKNMKDGEFSKFLPISSKDGTIFGVTGGVSEAFITTMAKLMGEESELLFFRKNEAIREYNFAVGKIKLKTAVLHGIVNFPSLLPRIKDFNFIEIMFCPYGCVGGPGQPAPPTEEKLKARAEALRRFSDGKKQRTPLENKPLMEALEWYGGNKINVFEELTYWGE